LGQQAAKIGAFEWNIQTGVNTWSPELEKMYGLAPGTFEGTQEAWEERVHPEDRDGAVAAVRCAFETDGPAEGEWRVVWPDGNVHWMLGRFQVSRDNDGKPLRLTGVNIDVSKRKSAEEALRESEQRYRGIVETAEEGITTHESDGVITYVNQRMADMLGCSREEIIGRSSFDFLNEEDREELIRERESMKARGNYSKEWKLHRKDGSMLWTLSNVSQRRDGGGNFMGYLAMHTDITELKSAEQQLRDLNDLLEHRVEQRTIKLEHQAAQLRQLATELTLTEQKERRRLAMILHDGLQQTLVAAKFGLALLERGGDARQKTADVAGLIDDCIEISRSLTAELSPPILYKGGLLPALEWLAKWMGDKHGLTVKLASQKPSERAPDQLDVLLFQSVRELLFNVVKHSGVRLAYVDVSESDGCIEVEVADDGAGFDVSQIRSREDRSTGMGLFSISERLSYLGGSLKINSAPGKGSRFSLFMPSTRVLEQGTEASPELQSSVSFATIAHKQADKDDGVRKIRIALVDDHMVMRQGLSGLLQVEPDMKIVGEASDGESAVALVREVKPDVVLMDIGMPGMDGIEATRRIHEQMPEVKIIGLSMFQEGEQAASILSAGAVAYLTKTGPSEAVLEAIRKCVKSKSRTAGKKPVL
jgi:PAS domain S-box-containing protein